MANGTGLPSLGGTVAPQTLQSAWAGTMQAAANLLTQATGMVAQIGVGGQSASQIIAAFNFFTAINNQMTSYAALGAPLATYAQAQVNNPSLNVVAAFTATQAALQAVINWIATNMPVDSQGFLQVMNVQNGVPTWVTFNAASLAPLVALLNTLAATIN